ncbi:unnamed protein product, partial [Heterobilharzia americana]
LSKLLIWCIQAVVFILFQTFYWECHSLHTGICQIKIFLSFVQCHGDLHKKSCHYEPLVFTVPAFNSFILPQVSP